MSRIDFVSRPYRDKTEARTFRAVVASCLFHGLLFGSVVGIGLLYRAHVLPIKSGSAPGAPAISVATLVIVPPPPPQPVPPPPPVHLSLPFTPSPATAPHHIFQTQFPEEGIPVLVRKPAVSTPDHPSKVHASAHLATVTQHPSRAPASSYAPGPNLFPPAPYPLEAQNHHETGVVLMSVQFNAEGNVTRADIAQSSGVPLLDSETRAFIRACWHSANYAGQTINQPVEYSLQNL